jgi:GNAT superfamily N-acetyltransferase
MNDGFSLPERLTPREVDAVGALARIVWQATYPALISQAQIDAMLADRYAPARIREQLDDPGHAWWVVRRDAGPVGFAHALLDASGCKLDKLYVHPDHQRRGIGAALLRQVEAWARKCRALRLWLQVNRGNAPAIRAYEKNGFRTVESRVFDIGNGFVMDDHVMEKRL